MPTRKVTRRATWPLAASVLLSGCGFHPLYASGPNGTFGAAETELAAVSVNIIPNRPGQLLRQALQERLERGGVGVARRYDLTVAFGLGGEGELIQHDSSVTRIRIIAQASWTLLAQSPRSTLTSGTARSVDGFDIINNQFFAADMSNDAVTRHLAEAIADQITLQLASYFSQHPATG